MLRRTHAVFVPDRVSVTDVIARLRGAEVIVVDVDNTLVPDKAPNEHLRQQLVAAREAAARAGADRLVAVSNGSRDRATVDGVVWQVNKPFTRRSRLGITPNDSVVVVGDRILVDGLLAWRWNAPIYLRPWSAEVSIPRSRPMQALAGWVQRRLFLSVPYQESGSAR